MMLILSLLASPAWGGCGKWVIRETTDYLKDPIFDEAVEASTESSATVSTEGAPINGTAETNSTTTSAVSAQPAASEKNAPAIDLAGKWRIILENEQNVQNTGKAMDMILIQNGDRLQGYGSIPEEDTDIPATATGTISGNGISLDVKLIEQKKDYRLDMALVNSELSGSYELYDAQKLAEKGNATASRSGS
jgi:hypothetical protein